MATDQARALDALTGPLRAEIVRRALASLGEAEPDRLLIAVDRVHHRPSVDTTVVYSVSFAAGDPALARPDDVLILTTAGVGEPSVAVEWEGLALRAWRHPDDPRLPALAVAIRPGPVATWLAAAGVHAGEVAAELMAYRPLRRAVVRVQAGEFRFYLKLTRPDRADGFVRRHELLDEAGLGPRVLGEPATGVLLTARVPGRSLAHTLVDWHREPSALPPPPAVFDLLDRLPRQLMELPRRSSWSDRADFHGETAAASLPDSAGEIRAMVSHVQRLMEVAPVGPDVPTHGDLYEANVFVEDAAFTRVIDVDAAGPGRREDDLACMLGHLAVLPDLAPEHYPRVAEVTQDWAAAFERAVDPVALRVRVAGVILSLCAGTSRAHALARLDLARSWLYRAESVR